MGVQQMFDGGPKNVQAPYLSNNTSRERPSDVWQGSKGHPSTVSIEYDV